jgi:hypothetical protein
MRKSRQCREGRMNSNHRFKPCPQPKQRGPETKSLPLKTKPRQRWVRSWETKEQTNGRQGTTAKGRKRHTWRGKKGHGWKGKVRKKKVSLKRWTTASIPPPEEALWCHLGVVWNVMSWKKVLLNPRKEELLSRSDVGLLRLPNPSKRKL